MTGPLHTDRLADTDLFIKALAYRMNAALGAKFTGAVRTVTDTGLTVDANGWITVPFPGLSTLSGAVLCARRTYVGGQREYLDPVPPASVGKLLSNTQPMLVLSSTYVGNTVRVRCLTSPQPTDGAGAWGSQPVKAGTIVIAAGYGWGQP